LKIFPLRDRSLATLIQTPKTLEPNSGSIGGIGSGNLEEPISYDEKDLQSPDHKKKRNSAPNSAIQRVNPTGKIALRKRITPIHDNHPSGQQQQKFNTPLKKNSTSEEKEVIRQEMEKKTFR